MADRDPEVQALLDKKAIEETLLLFLRGCNQVMSIRRHGYDR